MVGVEEEKHDIREEIKELEDEIQVCKLAFEKTKSKEYSGRIGGYQHKVNFLKRRLKELETGRVSDYGVKPVARPILVFRIPESSKNEPAEIVKNWGDFEVIRKEYHIFFVRTPEVSGMRIEVLNKEISEIELNSLIKSISEVGNVTIIKGGS